MRQPFREPGKTNGFLLLIGALVLFAGVLLALGSSALQARLAVAGIGALLIGYGLFTPGVFWEQAETTVVRSMLGPTLTRILIVAVGLGVIAWGFLIPMTE